MESIKDTLKNNDLVALLQSAQDLTSQIGLESLLKNILLKACELTDSPDGSIILYNKKRDSLYFADAIGENSQMLLAEWGENSKKNIPVNGSKSGEVFKTSTPLILDNVQDHFKGVDKDTQKNTKSMACVPLSVSGRNLGVMQLLNKKSGRFDKRDLVLLRYFSSLAAIAIRNAQLFKEIIIHMGFNALPYKGKDPLEFFEELEKPAKIETITILFADMRGFTRLCQILKSPESAKQHLNEYLTIMTKEIIYHNGMINKILGDGLLALFRGQDHAKNAVKCAFALTEGFNLLKKQWKIRSGKNLDFLDVGIGIVTDSVIIGTISGEYFRDYTVIGTAVNLSAAFEKSAKAGRRILVDQTTYNVINELVEQAEEPVDFVMKSDDQLNGQVYKQYHLVKLKPEI